jgi:bacterioferritin
MPTQQQTFLSDVQSLRDKARKSLSEGAVTPAYRGDVKKTIDILQSVLATEIVCVLRYTQHSSQIWYPRGSTWARDI